MDLISNVAREELYKRVLNWVTTLIIEVEDITVEKESLKKFSKYITQVKALLQGLHAKRVEARGESRPTIAVLQKLESDIKKACDVVKNYKSGSRLRLLVNSRSFLSQLQQSAKEIGGSLSLFNLSNLDLTLELKSKIDEIISGLGSMEFRSAAATEAIVSEIDKSIAQNGRSRKYATKLLQQIAEAVGASPNASLVRSEIALLKQEKEEMEAQKQHAEALQLSQLIQLLYNSEMVPGPSNERQISASLQKTINSFTCPLSGELMEDPVAINCGHSFERKAVLQHFEKGERCCPTCKEELSSLEVTLNISLRNSIIEWKHRNLQLKLQCAVSGVNSDEPNVLQQSLEDLQVLMETPGYLAEVTQQGLVPKLVDLLKTNGANTKATLKCLCYLAAYSEENKEAIAGKGAIRCIIKQFCRGEAEPEAVEVLQQLSEKEVLAEQIGNAKDSIFSLVSLLQNPNPDISQKSIRVLGNLSSNTHFVIKMAEAGHYKPFLARFQQGHSETKASMATALMRMQLNESTAKEFAHEQFISTLTKMLYSNTPAYKSACLHCIRKLSSYNGLVRLFLSDRNTIPALLGLCSTGSAPHWKQEATDILISLVGASQPSDYQTNPSMQELQSEHNIHVFLQLASTSIPQTKASLLQLLLAMVQKSDMVRDLLRSDQSAMALLFSSLDGDHHEVRLQALKLIHCIAEDNPAGIPLPQSPAKQSAVTALVTILTSSPNTEERSAAAAIISRLPADDSTVDEMLCKSEALKAIQEVICAVDDGKQGLMTKNPLPADSSYCLFENALAALLRYTEPTKPELQRQLGKLELYPSLVRVLSTGSSLAKQHTALALANLSQSTHLIDTTASFKVEQANNFLPLLHLKSLLHGMSWCCSYSPLHQSLCPVHGSACSSRQTFCLIKADAVRPLVQTLSERESGASEAALMALDTLFKDNHTLSHASAIIVESQGIAAILGVLERGSLSAKEKALDLFQKIFEHSEITKEQFQRSKGILIHLLQDETLKKKAALVLSQMKVIPQQSSYF